MKFLLIPDKFKGSLNAEEVINAISKGIYRACPQAEIHSVMASDGGDGFLNAVSKKLDCEEISVDTFGPLGQKIAATYLLDRSENAAYIELAKASGLELLQEGECDVMQTSTYGTGLQIKHAIEQGATHIYVGLGGSATNDAGTGIAKALGYRFLDALGNEIIPKGGQLSKIASIEKPEEGAHEEGISFFAVNDVDNPLYGGQGAAYEYAPQKGANAAEVRKLDNGLRHLDKMVSEQLKKNAAELPGAGAAGGTAYGLHVFFQAELVSGIDFILGLAKVNHLLAAHNFDYIITGEGKFDRQTLHGKLIKGVRDLGKHHRVPVIAVCGQLDVDSKNLADFGLERVLPIKDTSKSVQYSMQNAAHLIQENIYDFLMG